VEQRLNSQRKRLAAEADDDRGETGLMHGGIERKKVIAHHRPAGASLCQPKASPWDVVGDSNKALKGRPYTRIAG
jgi:hypothetical protein